MRINNKHTNIYDMFSDKETPVKNTRQKKCDTRRKLLSLDEFSSTSLRSQNKNEYPFIKRLSFDDSDNCSQKEEDKCDSGTANVDEEISSTVNIKVIYSETKRIGESRPMMNLNVLASKLDFSAVGSLKSQLLNQFHSGLSTRADLENSANLLKLDF